MLLTTLCAPFSALYVCGSLALALLPLVVGGCLAVYIISDVDPGEVGTADVASAAAATATVAIYFFLAFYMIYWRNIESYFSTLPWLSAASTTKAKVGERMYQHKCPFTGQFLENLQGQNIFPPRAGNFFTISYFLPQVCAPVSAVPAANAASMHRPSTPQTALSYCQ